MFWEGVRETPLPPSPSFHSSSDQSCKDSSYSSTFSLTPLSKFLSVFANVFPHQHSSSITSILQWNTHHSGFCSGPCVPQPRRLSSPHEVFPTPPTAHTRFLIPIKLISSLFPLQSVSCLSWVLQPLATPQSGQLSRLTPARMCSSISRTSRPFPHPKDSQS